MTYVPIELVLNYDGKCSIEYIEDFCSYIEISIEEFWETVNKFRGPMWKKDNHGNWKNQYHDELKKQL